jgi:hypothetical protein
MSGPGTAIVIVLVTSLSVFAQSAEEEVRKANDQILAAAKAATRQSNWQHGQRRKAL